MKNSIYIILLLLLSISSIFVGEKDSLTITYIANEGFMLEGGGKKVLVDALFGKQELGFCDVPSAETLDKIITAKEPFNDVDLVLVTHRHVDHFDADLMMSFLKNNSQCQMVGTQQAVDQLKEQDGYESVKSQIRSITPSSGQAENITIKGIDFTVLRLEHCTYFVTNQETGERVNRHKNMENLGFILNLGNHKILHIGDSGMENAEEFKNLKLDQQHIDIAFLGSLFWEPHEPRINMVNSFIQPKQIILMHLDENDKKSYGELKKTYQNRLAPITISNKELDHKTFVK